MKHKLILTILLLVLVSATVNAQFIQPLDCDKLFDDSVFMPQDEFNELAEVCFYGSGYTEQSVDVTLTNDDDTYTLEDVEVNNGVISSLAGVQRFFQNVVAGIYKLIVERSEDTIQYSEDVIVYAEDDDDWDDDTVINDLDNCPYTPNPNQEDTDEDTYGDVCDNCPETYNPEQSDSDSDGLGDACDDNYDGEIPEFGTIAAALVLLGAGVFIAKKRK